MNTSKNNITFIQKMKIAEFIQDAYKKGIKYDSTDQLLNVLKDQFKMKVSDPNLRFVQKQLGLTRSDLVKNVGSIRMNVSKKNQELETKMDLIQEQCVVDSIAMNDRIKLLENRLAKLELQMNNHVYK